MMFSKIHLALAAIILGLCGWIWVQSQNISDLTAKNLAQAQTIIEQQQANRQLTATIAQEREAIAKQTVLERTQREKAHDDVKIITRTLYKDNCAKQPLPGDVIKRLQ